MLKMRNYPSMLFIFFLYFLLRTTISGNIHSSTFNTSQQLHPLLPLIFSVVGNLNLFCRCQEPAFKMRGASQLSQKIPVLSVEPNDMVIFKGNCPEKRTYFKGFPFPVFKETTGLFCTICSQY